MLCTVALAQMGHFDRIKALNLPLSFKICVVDFSLARDEKSVANAFGLKISGCTFWVNGQFWPDVSAANKFASKDCKELQTLLFEI